MQSENRQWIEYFGNIIETGNLGADRHCTHVRACSEMFFDKLMLFFPEYSQSNITREDLAFAAVLHDIGKLNVPDWILQKPGRLTFEEHEIVRNHTRKGKKMFEEIIKILEPGTEVYNRFKLCAQVCMSHHERFDGKGYPEGLKGDEIPIAAQIVGLANAYDVLVSERIYKAAYEKDVAFEMIMEGESGLFSPKLLQIFQLSRMEIEEIYE